MTKKEQRKKELEAHYKALEKLAKTCGLKIDGKKLSIKLLKLDREAGHICVRQCNGIEDEAEEQMLSDRLDAIESEVMLIFNEKLDGFFINTDPRGYALKIQDDVLKEKYADVGLQRDWGGYGLLAPLIK